MRSTTISAPSRHSQASRPPARQRWKHTQTHTQRDRFNHSEKNSRRPFPSPALSRCSICCLLFLWCMHGDHWYVDGDQWTVNYHHYFCTVTIGTFGALVHGPTGHWFYGMLDSKMPGTKPITVASKVAIDQVRFFPLAAREYSRMDRVYMPGRGVKVQGSVGDCNERGGEGAIGSRRLVLFLKHVLAASAAYSSRDRTLRSGESISCTIAKLRSFKPF